MCVCGWVTNFVSQYFIVLYCTVMYYTVYTIHLRATHCHTHTAWARFSSLRINTAIVLCCTVLYCIIIYYIVLYNTVHYADRVVLNILIVRKTSWGVRFYEPSLKFVQFWPDFRVFSGKNWSICNKCEYIVTNESNQ